jgi:hypothetical protein
LYYIDKSSSKPHQSISYIYVNAVTYALLLLYYRRLQCLRYE